MRRHRRVSPFALAGLAAAGHACAAPPPSADTIFVNAVVWTADPARPRAEALATGGERILAVGSREEVLAHRGSGTHVLDLGGALVVPGFTDSHIHLLSPETAELDDATTLDEIQSRVSDWARDHPESAWVRGRGWTWTAFPDSKPHRRHLDAVVPDRPVLLGDRDGHTALANSAALRLAGIDRSTPDPRNGRLDRDPDGEPTGVLKEAAVDLVADLVPPPGPEERYRTLLRRLDQAAAEGLTAVHNASPIDLDAYRRARDEGRLKLRVYAALPFRADLSEEEMARYRELRDGSGPRLRFGSVKGMLDGTIDAQTAALLEPYAGSADAGIPMWSQADLDRAAARFDREGFQIWLHAIGDRAVRMALDAFEHAASENGPRDRRHRVEHAELVHPDDLPRFAAAGVVASTQPIFANPDQNVLENFSVVLGAERASRADAFRLFDAAGARQVFGSDFPVFTLSVRRGLYAAVTRTTPAGTPEGGWYPGNRIDVQSALRHYTVDAAWGGFEEDERGRLAPGLLADLVVLSQDLTRPPARRILDAEVLLTLVGGEVTHRDEGFHPEPVP